MPRPNPGPRLDLYGPDSKFGAKPRSGFSRYIWYIVWSDRGRKREQSTGASFEDRSTAEGRLRDFLDARARAWRATRRPDQMTIADVLDTYGSEHAQHTMDPTRIGYCIDALVRWWGDQTVSAITAPTCRAYARDRRRSSGTVRRELGVLRAAIRYCVREGRLTQEVPVVLPERTASRDLWLSRTEVALLLLAARGEAKARLHLPLFILLGLYTGHRKSAILQLQWQPNTIGGHVDVDAGIIDFQGRRRSTRKRRARIPIPKRLATFLNYARSRTRQYVIEHDEKALINIKRSFGTACARAAELSEQRAAQARTPLEQESLRRSAAKLRETTPHTLRHTAVTWLVQKGVPLFDVGRWVGMSTEMVDRVYGHHAPELMNRARLAIDRR